MVFPPGVYCYTSEWFIDPLDEWTTEQLLDDMKLSVVGPNGLPLTGSYELRVSGQVISLTALAMDAFSEGDVAELVEV